jgi:hypothetical protein
VPPEASPLPNLVFEVLPDLCLMVSYQLETAATDAEWDAYLVAMDKALRSSRFRSIAVTEGAHPTRAQQARLTAVVKGKPARVAVLTSASGVRFVVSVLALMNRDVKAFTLREYEAAFIHLDLAFGERIGVPGVIARLRERLDPPEPVTVRRRRSELLAAANRRS